MITSHWLPFLVGWLIRYRLGLFFSGIPITNNDSITISEALYVLHSFTHSRCFYPHVFSTWIKQIKTHVSFVIHAKWKQIEKVTSIDSTVLLIKRYFANFILRPNHLLKICYPAIKLVKQKHSHFNMSIVRFLDETHSNSKV